ncbi:MAG: hypothetical protein AAF431_13670 [Pseudomonadota bacterium]
MNEIDAPAAWQQGRAILLKGICLESLGDQAHHIKQSSELHADILRGTEGDELFAAPPYSVRLEGNFEPLGSSSYEGDDQEIETIVYDAVRADKTIAEDLWIKISWLSFYEHDESLRFRFSFGEDWAEDVAADKMRQQHAALLTDAIFPESRCITENAALASVLSEILGSRQIRFVERIVYFNAPEGGAYLHHDHERGHAGVAYAQLTGDTFWLALGREQLVQEIIEFIATCASTESWPAGISRNARGELLALSGDPIALVMELESFANDALIHLINEELDFVQQLIQHGHGQYVRCGDVLLLPQENAQNCCWHSVFCVGEQTGQALSFAIRTN